MNKYPIFQTDNAYAACTPYINFNGNRKEDLIESASNIDLAIDSLIILISTSDLDHGRNGMTEDHRREMSRERTHDMKVLRTMRDKYRSMAENMASL